MTMGNNTPVKTLCIFVFFGIYTQSGPTSFFHSFAISIIEREPNRNHMIISCVFFLSFLDFSVSISISILYRFSLNYVP